MNEYGNAPLKTFGRFEMIKCTVNFLIGKKGIVKNTKTLDLSPPTNKIKN